MSSQHARLSDSYDDDMVNKRGGTPSQCDMDSAIVSWPAPRNEDIVTSQGPCALSKNALWAGL